LLPHHLDPASTLDKAMEIALYLGVGTLAGLLVDRERRANRRAAREAVERLSAQKDAERFQGLVHLTRGLAHEIRNPLGSIQGAIEILAAAVPPERPEHEMATIGLREVARLNRVLTDFLAFARPRPPELRPLAPADAVSHVVDLLASEASSRGVTLRRGTVTAPEAIGDADQVTQVLVNLVRNAIAASPAGARVEVAVSSQDLDGRPGVLFEVSDEGPGVPAALGAAIYDPYVTGREDGTGLGLSIASALAQQQNGLLGHHGREGGGAVFWFRLPASAEEAA
jgi:signal transduction histidine kinase